MSRSKRRSVGSTPLRITVSNSKSPKKQIKRRIIYKNSSVSKMVTLNNTKSKHDLTKFSTFDMTKTISHKKVELV